MKELLYHLGTAYPSGICNNLKMRYKPIISNNFIQISSPT
jgi:hypothetical protein